MTLYFSLHSVNSCCVYGCQARKLQLLQLCGVRVWSWRRNFPSSSFVTTTGKRLNIKHPLKSPHMQMLFVHNFQSTNKLYRDYFQIFQLIVLRTWCGTAGRAASGEAGAHPGQPADPRPQLHPLLLIRHPRHLDPRRSTRSGCGLDSTAFSSSFFSSGSSTLSLR